MYDNMIATIILCSEELEDAIDMRALHVTEIRDRVINQIEKIPREEEVLETRNQKKKESPTYDKRGNKGNKPTDTSDPKNHPDCRDDHRTSYEQRSQLLSSYIISRKENIFYSRNIKLALVAQDPLGEAFKVKAFHRCQVNNLLRSQLVPYRHGQ